jgi:hypothetical protein
MAQAKLKAQSEASRHNILIKYVEYIFPAFNFAILSRFSPELLSVGDKIFFCIKKTKLTP